MDSMFVEELGFDLYGRELAIWNGTSGLSPAAEAEYRRRWRERAKRSAPPPDVGRQAGIPDCRFRGEPTGNTVVCPECNGRVELKLYECSVHVQCTLGKQAEGVKCCRTCRDRRGPVMLVTVPTPPKYTGPITSATAIVTGATGGEYNRLLDLTAPYMEAFAERVGADFVRLDWGGHPDWPMSGKFMFSSVLRAYYEAHASRPTQLLWLDCDVLMRPGCVNSFDFVPAGSVGGFDELPVHIAHPTWKAVQGATDLRRFMGLPVGLPPFHFNGGVVVAPGEAWPLFAPPTGPIPAEHCAEQDWINARVWQADHPFARLPMTCNWERWIDPGFRNAPPEAVLHWSGPYSYDERYAQIRDFARRYPL